jgi:phosphosulfolactate synthase (CoM biosynthesis protein A)
MEYRFSVFFGEGCRSAAIFVSSAMSARGGKPRTRGVTEIRGPYYTVMGPRYLQGILDTMDEYVDGLKFAGGSFALMPGEKLEEMISLAQITM